MPLLLSRIDDLSRSDHSYLAEDDDCYFIGEYTARRGYSYSDTNQLISNLKKEPHLRGTAQWQHKMNAIRTAARQFCNCISSEWLKAATLVPIPPSCIRSDPGYDDRLFGILQEMNRRLGTGLDIRELILQRRNIPPFHEQTGRRLRPREIADFYYIDDATSSPVPRVIGLFDDVITTGSHFKGAKLVLEEAFPSVPIKGIFLARRVPDPTDTQSLFDIAVE